MTEENTTRTAMYEAEAEQRSEGQKIEDLDVLDDVEDVKGGGTGNGGSQDPGDIR
jgi:hypothetical protein